MFVYVPTCSVGLSAFSTAREADRKHTAGVDGPALRQLPMVVLLLLPLKLKL